MSVENIKETRGTPGALASEGRGETASGHRLKKLMDLKTKTL